MRTLNIKVGNEQDYHKLKTFLKTIASATTITESKPKTPNATTLISEEALAEEWLSAEDERYEKYFKL